MHTCTLELDVVTELNGIFYSGMRWAKGNVLKSNFFWRESKFVNIVYKE